MPKPLGKKNKIPGAGGPAMTSELPETPIYDYRHHLNRIRPFQVEPAPARAVGKSGFHLETHGTELCAIGFCPDCGRTVISAVHRSKDTLRMLCGRCYRW